MNDSTSSIVSIALTLRDLQWLIMTDVLTSTILNPGASDDALERNADAAERLYYVHYTQEEQDALRTRMRALLPHDTPIVFASPQFPVDPARALPS